MPSQGASASVTGVLGGLALGRPHCPWEGPFQTESHSSPCGASCHWGAPHTSLSQQSLSAGVWVGVLLGSEEACEAVSPRTDLLPP